MAQILIHGLTAIDAVSGHGHVPLGTGTYRMEHCKAAMWNERGTKNKERHCLHNACHFPFTSLTRCSDWSEG